MLTDTDFQTSVTLGLINKFAALCLLCWVGLITAGHRRTAQDSTGLHRTAQDTAGQLQDSTGHRCTPQDTAGNQMSNIKVSFTE